MENIIKKYEVKLDFLNKSLEQFRSFLDEDQLNTIYDLKKLLTEFITDLNNIKDLSKK